MESGRDVASGLRLRRRADCSLTPGALLPLRAGGFLARKGESLRDAVKTEHGVCARALSTARVLADAQQAFLSSDEYRFPCYRAKWENTDSKFLCLALFLCIHPK